jgi:hypothetical protein
MNNELITEEIANVAFDVEVAKYPHLYTVKLSDELTSNYIISKYNPLSEAKNNIASHDKGNLETVWVIVGFEFGYKVRELRKLVGEEVVIIVIEPNKNLLKEQMNMQSLEEKAIYKGNTYFVAGADQINVLERTLGMYLTTDQIYNYRFLCSEMYKKFYPHTCKKILDSLLKCLRTNYMNLGTTKTCADEWNKNLIKNLPSIAKSYDLAQHHNKYKDIPAVVVSAGPSLEKNIEHLKDFKGMILTGSRNLENIYSHGVKPHFLVSVDPSVELFEQLRTAKENKEALVTTPVASYDIIQNNKGPQYFIGVPYERQIVEKLFNKDIPFLSAGGSVATTCCSLAYLLGCNPIIFIGQDLAFTNDKLHADGCGGEDADKREIRIKRAGYYGGEVETSHSFDTFKNWFEWFAKTADGITCINATEGGVRIEGMLQKPFKEVVEEYSHIQTPYIKHKKDDNTPEYDMPAIMTTLKQNMEKLISLAQKGKEKADQLEKEYSLFKGDREKQINKILKELDSLDDRIEKNDASILLERLRNNKYKLAHDEKNYVPPLEEDHIEQGKRIAKKNHLIYEALRSAAEDMLKIIDEEIL